MKSLLLAFLFALPLYAEQPTYVTKDYHREFPTGFLYKEKELREFALSHASVERVMRAGAIPGRADLTRDVSPPEDQGACGSCWAFGLTKALRSALMIAGKDPGTLAFNYLLNNCGPGPKMYGCGGGMFEAGESFLNNHGPWLEAQDPYRAKEGRCASLPMAGTAISFKTVGDGKRPPSFQELAQSVADKHMLVIDVAVAGSWGSYHGGIYNGNGSGINHMINMVGYDCETSVDSQGNCTFNSNGQPSKGDGFLIVENNWGTRWGENGYMRTRWGKNQIAETAMYFEVDAPVPPPPPPPPPGPNPKGKDFSIDNDVASVKGTVKADYVQYYNNIVKVLKGFLESFKE